MRTIILSIAILFFSLNNKLMAQRHGAYVGGGSEFTVGGGFWSFQAGVELNRHRIGFLYETRMDKQDNPYNESYNLKALLYNYTFYRQKNLQLGMMIRGGLSNDQFIVVVPALTTAFVFNDYLKVNMVSGIRANQPAIGFNLFINIPFKKNEFPYPVFNF